MNKFLIAPILVCFVIAIVNIFFGDGFQAGLWLFASLLLSVIFLPTVIDMNDKDVPILQIFSVLLFLIVFFSIFAFFDFKKAGFLLERALLYGVGVGFGGVAILMLMRNEK